MYILSVNISHHASMCLLKDGEVVFYLENDRITRIKEDNFQIYTNNSRLFFDKINQYTNHVDYLIITSYGRSTRKSALNYDSYEDNDFISYVTNNLKTRNISYDKFIFENEHHLYHAMNAFYSTNFESAISIVMDGGGVYHPKYENHREIESIYYHEKNQYETIKKVYGININKIMSYPGQDTSLYGLEWEHNVLEDDVTLITKTVGCGGIFKCTKIETALYSDGKVMGLFPYGDSERLGTESFFEYNEELDTWITNNEIISQYLKRGEEKITFLNKSDLCAKAQKETKEHTIRVIEQALSKTNVKNVVLSGGYFLNCVNNYEYIKAFPDVKFYVDPLSHDGGTAMGAAKYVWHVLLGNIQKNPLKHLYLG